MDVERLLRCSPLLSHDHILCREIQHPRRHHRHSEVCLPLLFQGKEVQQHLYAQAVLHLAEVKGFFPGLIVHHPQVEPPVLYPAVHSVHLAHDPQGDPLPLHADCRQIRILPAEIHLKLQQLKVRLPHFIGNAPHHCAGSPLQPLKQVAEPCAFLAVPIDFRPGEFSGELLHQCVQLLRLHAGKAAPVPDRAQHIFQQIVEEGSDFRCLEPGGFSLLSPQTVLHEVAEMAAFHAIHPGRGHLHLGSVQGTHRLR